MEESFRKYLLSIVCEYFSERRISECPVPGGDDLDVHPMCGGCRRSVIGRS